MSTRSCKAWSESMPSSARCAASSMDACGASIIRATSLLNNAVICSLMFSFLSLGFGLLCRPQIRNHVQELAGLFGRALAAGPVTQHSLLVDQINISQVVGEAVDLC